MSTIEAYFQQAAPALVIDWPYLLKRREHLLNVVHGLPPYLLLPEIQALLHNTQDVHLHFLVSTLWNTGARISEALPLVPADFHLDDPDISFVSIETLKKRVGRPTSKLKLGRPLRPLRVNRIVPLYSRAYKNELLTYAQAFQVKSMDVLFPKVRFTYNKQLENLQAKLMKLDIIFPVKLTPHLFRHSFAINCLLHRISLSDIRDYLGHSNIKETEVYTRIFTGETHGQMKSVCFD